MGWGGSRRRISMPARSAPTWRTATSCRAAEAGRRLMTPCCGLPRLRLEPLIGLTYNWDPQPYAGGRNFGHLAYAVDNIYDTCSAFIARSVTINRPPRDGRMAFIRTPDGISIELLQAGGALPPAEPWTSMANTGSW